MNMELDVLKEKWAEHDRKLDISIRLNWQLLTMLNMQRLRSPLRRFAVLVGLGALPGLALAGWLGQFIFNHWAEPRFALPAILLDMWAIAMMAASIRLMATAFGIDYSQPVAAIQRQVESLRVLRIRVTEWALLTGQLVWWIPALIVALKAFWDVDAYRACGTAFLAVNVAFGLALIPLLMWASPKFGDRIGREFAGYNLNAAKGFLEHLRAFETETYPTLE